MVVGSFAIMKRSRLAKLFKLKAKIGNMIMLGVYNSSTHLVAENKKYLAESRIFGDDPLLGLEWNQSKNVDIKNLISE